MATQEEMAAVSEVLKPLRNPCIVELGARVGEEEQWVRESCGEEAHYVMVEPDARNCQIILDKGISQTRRLIIGAVASHTGTVEFHGSLVDGNTRGSGSIRKPTKHYEIFPAVEFPEDLRTKVPCYTLDAIFEREWLSKIDLLWVDVQGAEKDVIAGGQKALTHTRYLFIETEDRELYEGMAVKAQLLRMLEGWQLMRDLGYNCLLGNPNFSEQAPR